MRIFLRLLAICWFLLAVGGVMYAQTYVGSQQCSGCHGVADVAGAGYNIWVEFNKTGHPYKLNEVSGAPPVYPQNTSPGVPNAPPAAPDWNDYAYVIGGYGWKARFIKDADGLIFTADAEAQYNLATEGWVPYHLGEDRPYNYNCFQCHTTGASPEGSWHPTTPDLGTFTEPGIRCEGCHGPASEHVGTGGGTPPPIQGDDLTFQRCGDCHSRGSKTNAIPASGNYIRHHEQFNEMLASQHGNGDGVDLTCGSCHNTHIALLYPEVAGDGLNAIVNDCQSCHPNQEIITSSGQPKPIDCVDCHMPRASKSAVGSQVGNGWVGDVATHIWGINTEAVTREAMFTEDGGLVALDEEGIAAVTLDFVCLPCHQQQTVEWASRHAQGIHEMPLAIDDRVGELPTDFVLAQNYPNPFNPATTIEFVLPKTARVRLAVYNLLGQEVAELLKGVRPAGTHRIDFAGSDLPSGVYVYRLTSNEVALSRKMILMK